MMNTRKTIKNVIAGSALTLFAMPAIAADLTLNITGVIPNTGQVQVGLMDGPEGFPMTRTPLVGEMVKVGAEDNVSVTFKNLPAGTYAVSVFQDEDNDGKMATNFLGAPQEPFGFSNNAMSFFGPPSFESAAITVGSEDVTTSIELQKL